MFGAALPRERGVVNTVKSRNRLAGIAALREKCGHERVPGFVYDDCFLESSAQQFPGGLPTLAVVQTER
jgi:hypothetical protein